VLELVMPADSHVLDKPLMELEVPTGAIIGVIVRGEQVVIPTGSDKLEPGDHVVVFMLPEAISRVEKFFS
jgi:trk system potassium uptake protein TrkA